MWLDQADCSTDPGTLGDSRSLYMVRNVVDIN